MESVDQQFQNSLMDRKMWKTNLITCERDNLNEFLVEMLSTTNKEKELVNNVRGSLIGYMSEMDDLVCEAIKNIWSKLTMEERSRMLGMINEAFYVDTNKPKRSKSGRAAKKLQDFNWIVDSESSFPFKSRVLVLQSLLKFLNANRRSDKINKRIISDFTSLHERNKFNNFTSLIDIRNIYAHKAAKIINSRKHRHVRDYKRIRMECRKHHNNINAILRMHPGKNRFQ